MNEDAPLAAIRLARQFTRAIVGRRQRSRVAIVAPASSGSLGDDALFDVLCAELREGGCDRIVRVAESHRDLAGYESADDTLLLHRGNLARAIWSLRELAKCDHLIVVGADVMDGAYGRSATRRFSALSIATRLGLDTSLVSFSFSDRATSESIAQLKNVSEATRIVVRDPVSCRLVREHLPGRDIIQGADLAFLLAPDQDAQVVSDVRDWISGFHDSDPSITIAVNFNQLACPDSQIELCLESYRKALVTLSKTFAATYVFLPHDYRPEHNELGLLEDLKQRLPTDVQQRTLVLSKRLSVQQLKGICRLVDMAIVGRMHMAIGCVSQSIPVMCMDYQGKVEGLAEHCGISSIRVSSEQLTDSDVFAGLATKFCANRHEFRNQLKQSQAKLQELARINIPILNPTSMGSY